MNEQLFLRVYGCAIVSKTIFVYMFCFIVFLFEQRTYVEVLFIFEIVALNLPFQVPRNRYWGLHPPPAPLEDVVDDGLMAIQRAIFLKKAGVDTTVHEDFVLNPPTRADLLELAIKNMSRCL